MDSDLGLCGLRSSGLQDIETMNRTCPCCGKAVSLTDLRVQILKREAPKWYQPSNIYGSRKCPFCGCEVKLHPRSRVLLTSVLIVVACIAVGGLFVPPAGKLILFSIIAIVVVAANRQLRFERA